MADLIMGNTDDEVEKYEEAYLIASNPPPMDSAKSKTLNFNRRTGKNDVLLPLSSGGYAKVGEEPIPRVDQVKKYARELQGMNAPFDMADYDAAGFTAEEVQAAGIMPVQAPTSGRSEPMTEGETLIAQRQGNEILQAGPNQSLFEGAVSEVTKGLARGGLVRPSQFLKENLNVYDPLVFQIVDPVTGEFDPQLKIVSREEKAEIDRKIEAGEMPYAVDFERLVESDPESGAGAQVAGSFSQFLGAFAGVGKLFRLGSGATGMATQGVAADFLAFRGDEGRLTDLLLEMGVPEGRVTNFFKTDPNDPDYVGRFKTALEGTLFGAALAPVLIGMGKTFRAIKDGDVVPEAARDAVAKGKDALGNAFLKQVQNAEARIAERGTGTTMFSNPVGPVVDRGLVAAGRLADMLEDKYPDVTLDISGDAEKGYELSRIVIPDNQRSKGMGTKVMQDVVDMADEQGARISLTPDTSFGGSSVSRLKDFYKRFGFVENKGKNKDFSTRNTMYRDPQEPKVAPDPVEDISFVEPKQVEAPTDEKRGIIAFHGSGADFDKFELSKIGTGEQAQAFGHGLYFTDSEDIAEFYRQSVRGRQDLSLGYEVSYKGNKVSDLGDTPLAEVQPYENAAINKIADNISKVTTMATKDLPQSELVQLAKDKAIKTLEGEIKRTAERTSGSMFDELTDLIGNSLDDELKALQAIDPNDVSFAEGKKYQVRLDVSPEDLLNWDMPFDKQTPTAQRAILKTADEITLDDAMNLGVDVFDAPYNGDEAAALDAAKKILLDDFSVNRFLNTWSAIRGSDNAGEELLAKNGLKGITYKADQGPTARGPMARDASAGGPSNYVIFDDKLINIMKKYGIVGPVAVSAMASQEQEEI